MTVTDKAWSWFKTWFHKWGSPKLFYQMSKPWMIGCLVLGVLVLGYGLIQGMMFAPTDFKQKEIYRIIYIHVPSAMVSMSAYAAVAMLGAITLIWKMKVPAMIAKQVIVLGATFSLLTLVTGAIWGEPTWGTWWVWDARLTSMLAQFLLFCGLWVLHVAIEDQNKADKACAVLSLFGVVNLVIIKYSVEWWNTLHQPATFKIFSESKIDGEMATAFWISVLGLYLIFTALVLMRARIEVLKRSRKAKWARAEFDRLLEKA